MYQRLLWVNTSHFMFSLKKITAYNTKDVDLTLGVSIDTSLETWVQGAGVAQRLCNGLPRNDPGFDFRWGRCKNHLHVLRKGHLMRMVSLNDLAVDCETQPTNLSEYSKNFTFDFTLSEITVTEIT